MSEAPPPDERGENAAKRHSPSSWLLIGLGAAVFVLLSWYLLGVVLPKWCYATSSQDFQALRGQLGDQFGMVNSLFSALAFTAITVSLYLQSRALRHAIESQDAALAAQSRAIAFELVLAVTDDIRSTEWGAAHQELAKWKTRWGNKFVKVFSETRERAETDGHKVDGHRRVFIEPLYKVFNCFQARAVTKDLAKVVIGPDVVVTILEILEPLEKGIRVNCDDSMFRFFESFYSKEELDAKGPYIREASAKANFRVEGGAANP